MWPVGLQRLPSIGQRRYLQLIHQKTTQSITHAKVHHQTSLRRMAAIQPTPNGDPDGITADAQEMPYTFIDIGSNLGDPVFRGEYHGKQAHPDDFEQILTRARSAGVVKQILTGDCLNGSKEVRELARKYEGLYATVGCHPCRANEFEAGAKSDSPAEVDRSAKEYLEALDQLIAEDQASGQSRVVAVGECGLDYDRLSHCSKEIQLRYFPPQLELATKYKLPLFLHSRTSEAHVDFVRIIRAHEARHTAEELLPARKKGVVHSFTGTIEEMKELVDLGFSIGINGCSLKTEDNLEVVKAVPLDRLMLETDCPWCEIRPSHASHRFLSELPLKHAFSPPAIKKEKHQVADEKMVKGRNEPCTIGQVAWVVSKLKGIPLAEVTQSAWKNSVDMFPLL
ncbi:hypothetical protein PGT21_037191 [Puccinia graminis f. sp. tritici]|uniref:TatD DNase n=2 Tax=Puccinia graminis f. sp. tritici TaxID=56615 RepID=E3KIR3_PUCGT|nr:uncharacterized protein PGTG_10566 [Puccinia graminis f. sp. tritici CRL 75-36-700-3]EFP84188.2 hypothetical protein PGTG_10566 [Puccinia graminis f. sp. tritici CRL 75-36-700-3]KAA1120134.1 hypothetical protein PGT21_037191 [Puccinia graminis f. sp. tritici]